MKGRKKKEERRRKEEERRKEERRKKKEIAQRTFTDNLFEVGLVSHPIPHQGAKAP